MANFQLNFLSDKELKQRSSKHIEQWGNTVETNQSWKEEYKKLKDLKKHEINLLEKGAQSQSQAWLLNKMWSDWQEIKETRSKQSNPKIQRSSKEWEKAFIEWKKLHDKGPQYKSQQ
tara:strand:- start:2664 stop:3014 length:351 start_codon:yes stop_codon:yes gene_type:complete